MPILPFEDFKDIHKGQDIYILASGASFDYIDKTFFENKITIGINEIYKLYPPTYLIRKDPALLKESLQKNPTTLHFITRGEFGGGNTKNRDFIQKSADLSGSPIVIFEHNTNTHILRVMCMIVFAVFHLCTVPLSTSIAFAISI